MLCVVPLVVRAHVVLARTCLADCHFCSFFVFGAIGRLLLLPKLLLLLFLLLLLLRSCHRRC